MQIDAGAAANIAGVETQGRKDLHQWMETYKLDYSLDGIEFHHVDGGNTFAGNYDQSTKVPRYLPHPFERDTFDSTPRHGAGIHPCVQGYCWHHRKSTRKLAHLASIWGFENPATVGR